MDMPHEAHEEMLSSFLPFSDKNGPLVVSPPKEKAMEGNVRRRRPRKEGRVRPTHHVKWMGLTKRVVLGKKKKKKKPVLMKVVVMGNLGVGKTSLVAKLSGEDGFDPVHPELIPVKFDNRTLRMFYGRKEVRVSLWDTEMWDTSFSMESYRRKQISEAGEDYSQMRLITYLNTDVFLLCFDLTDKLSFEYITSKWVREIFRFAPYTPFVIILCGTKSDRKDERQVSKKDALACAKHIKAYAYVECSTGFFHALSLSLSLSLQKRTSSENILSLSLSLSPISPSSYFLSLFLFVALTIQVTGANLQNVVIACVDGVMEMLPIEKAQRGHFRDIYVEQSPGVTWEDDGPWREPLGGWSDQVLNPSLNVKGRWMDAYGDVGRVRTPELVEEEYLAFKPAEHTVFYC
ncbi:Ras-related C3 botulinum toxin substrate 2 [Balamuthia mandrillaris]